MNIRDPEVAARIRQRCREGISGPSVRSYRKKALKYTGPIHQIRPDNAQNTNAQLQSLFYQRLPYDIRVLIYAEILKPMNRSLMWHFIRAYRGLSHCNLICSQSCFNNHAAHAWDGFVEHCPTLATQCDDSFLDLFLICRRGHFEAMHVLYSRTNFILFDISGLQSFLTRTPTHYLNVTTSISLTWLVFPPLYLQDAPSKAFYSKKHNPTATEQAWSNLWIQIAQMPRLSKLHITIHNLQLSGIKLLEPIIEAFRPPDETESGSWDGEYSKPVLNCPPDFKISFYYTSSLPCRLPFTVDLLSETEDWKSAPGAKVWPPPPYRDPTVWDRLGERVVGMCAAVGNGVVRAWRRARARLAWTLRRR